MHVLLQILVVFTIVYGVSIIRQTSAEHRPRERYWAEDTDSDDNGGDDNNDDNDNGGGDATAAATSRHAKPPPNSTPRRGIQRAPREQPPVRDAPQGTDSADAPRLHFALIRIDLPEAQEVTPTSARVSSPVHTK